jgi:6-phosphogluconolactonase (cycloisomerase 2 family)
VWSVCAAVGLVTIPMIAGALVDAVNSPARVVLYASVGEELTAYTVDVDRGTLTKQSTVTLPGFAQEAWASATPYIYVAWSSGGASYAGTGVAPTNTHGITAFRIDPGTGALHAHGAPAALRARPIYITGDVPGTHLLVAYNDPSGVSVHAINGDGTIGGEIKQAANLDTGIYGHQVRVMPGNRSVILVTRGNQATGTAKEDAGAVKLFHYGDGKLTNVASIAPANGLGFRSRHLDFHPTRPWIFLTLESQNRLLVFSRTDDGLASAPIFSKGTLANGGGERPGQTASTVHVHPNGQFVYVGNRNGAPAANGGSNDIAVFGINQETGEPSLIQNVDTHGITPRTFSIDPSGRLLVVGNQTTIEARDGAAAIPANLAVFRIQTDGRLEFVRRYEAAVGQKPLWWTAFVALH